jgi:dTDP-glucose pyrophosphorylase
MVEARKAVILARGLGTRMRRADPGASLEAAQAEVAAQGVKAMIPIGRPFIDYVLSGLADAGYSEACLVIGPEHGLVRDHYAQLPPPSRIRIGFAVQQEPKGTADAVLAAEDFVAGQPFLVINSDNYYPVEALRALRLLGGPGLAAFSIRGLVHEGGIPEDRVRRWAALRFDADGWLLSVDAEGDATQPDTAYVSVNCWRFSRAIFRACRAIRPSPNGELELSMAAHYAATSLGERFKVLTFKGTVLDLSSRADIARVAARLRDTEVRL